MINAVRSRRSLMQDLFLNMFDDQALFNHQEDASNTMAIDNIQSAELFSVVKTRGNSCMPIYEAAVNFQFVNPKIPTIPEGTRLRFVVVNEEIKGLGWRIEEIYTAPGVSQKLCWSK